MDLSAQLRLAGLPIPAECRFDENTADTGLTRVLCGAALRLLRLPGVTVPTKQALQRLGAMLGEAGPCTPEDIRVPAIFTRLDEHCHPAEPSPGWSWGTRPCATRLARLASGSSSST